MNLRMLYTNFSNLTFVDALLVATHTSNSCYGDDVILSTLDTETLLANVGSRNKLLDDLMELKGFLTQRIAELNSNSDFPLAVQVC